MSSSERTYGVTPPMNSDLPKDEEKRATDLLLAELRRQKTFEAPAETEKRKVVLESIQKICNEFVKTVARIREPKNEFLQRNAVGKVFTYGSYRLGVFGPGSDIDTLVIAPKYVTREDYFEHFPGLLETMAPKGAITDLAVVTDAFVPIIKFEYSGISIDLIFSRVMQTQLTLDLDLKDDNILRGLDERELRSVNGTRVTDEILDLVPEKSTFRLALRAIKLWAQRRAVYANIMGFPGGVAWAMLVARICQLYPKATASVVVKKFFLVIHAWPWPKPCLLKPIETVGKLPARVWNPQVYHGDKYHLMPIITPAYPSMCSTFNVTRSSMTVIQRELQRGLELTEKIMAEKLPWSDLFTKHTFFTKGYKFYIYVISASRTKEAHKLWSGYVESKVRVLVQKLETHDKIKLAHAFNKSYTRRHNVSSVSDIQAVENGSLDFLVSPDEMAQEAGGVEPHQNGIDAQQDEKSILKEEPAEAQDGITAPTSAESNPEQAKDDAALNKEGKSIVKEEPVEAQDGIPAPPSEEPNPEQAKDDDAAAKQNGNGPSSNETEAPTPDWPIEVYTTTHYIGLELVDKPGTLDLSYQINDFKQFCLQWPTYQEKLQHEVNVSIQHTRNFNLPDDVFAEGEKKPTKPVKKSAANSKKREATEENSNPPPAKKQQSSVAAVG